MRPQNSSENARVVKDLMGGLALRGLDLNISKLWVKDGSKALRSGIEHPTGGIVTPAAFIDIVDDCF